MIVAAFLVVVLVGGGLILSQKGNTPKTDDTMLAPSESEGTRKDDQMEKDKMEGKKVEGYQGVVLAGDASPLLDFNKADYDTAVASGKVVFLYFYANWCPICRVEVPNELYPAFNELQEPNVVGFRANHNDDETDDDEKALAKQFGITYQHSKVILKDGKEVLKSLDTWDKERYLKEIATYLN